MLTTKQYNNLVVFWYLSLKWEDNTIGYIMEKYNLLFSKLPDKVDHVMMLNILYDKPFNDKLDKFKIKWKLKHISDDDLKVLYFTNSILFDRGYHPFQHYIIIYNKFFTSYDFIYDRSMICLLHENFKQGLRRFNDEHNEKFRFLYLKEKLTKYKQHV